MRLLMHNQILTFMTGILNRVIEAYAMKTRIVGSLELRIALDGGILRMVTVLAHGVGKMEMGIVAEKDLTKMDAMALLEDTDNMYV